MYVSMLDELRNQIVPFLPHLFSFALIILPVSFLAHINNESEPTNHADKSGE